MNPLVSAAWLLENISNPNLRVVDTRFWLGQPSAGLDASITGHIEGAIFLDLETDLSSPKHPNGTGGRHPLPDPETLAQKLSGVGIGSAHLIVAYDDPSTGQGFYAAHLWWLMRYLGHDQVQVLDGGLPAWTGKLETGISEYPKVVFTPRVRPEMLVSAEEVAARDTKTRLIDARAPERYLGLVEPLDKKAGHIPGAENLPWTSALEHGFWKSSVAQGQRFNLEDPHQEIILYCGSGVSACSNALSLELAGVQGAKLYAGSWSDWISDDSRPTE